jgi:peptidoglycan/xylan/chitin deacetylase (PgdA/CDA1 family)
MAEIQWVIEVRCVNTLLAKFMVGERGLHICAHVPNRDLDPHEFAKLIEGAQEAGRIASDRWSAEHRSADRRSARQEAAPIPPSPPLNVELGTVREVEMRGGQYEIQILRTGEMVVVDMPGAVLGPSELERFIAELKAIQGRLIPLP